MADYPQPLSTDYPVALFPVRLETRFFTGAAAELRVRVYPDEIVADLHEPLLSHEEIDAGKAYWTEAFQLGAELDPWRRLRGLFGPQRAAYIVKTTIPTNLPPGWPTVPSGPPLFRTDIPTREGAARAARTTVLPDRWVAIAYRNGQEILRRQGELIDPNLVLAYRPDVAEGSPELESRDELKIERDLLWTIDFERACAVGMGMKLPLSATDLSLGFDRLLVVGVKTTLSPSAGGDALGALLDAHHYTRGLALVPQGTPTNNTGEEAAGYPPPDDPEYSYAIERVKVDLDIDLDNHTDGAALARALGVKKSAFAHVEGAKRREQEAARSMNQALWPCTMGYFLEQMMRPLLSSAQISDVRQHFETYVRGRGPLPAFRVGRVPYGLLPTTSLQPVAGSSSSTNAASAATPTPRAEAAPAPSAPPEGRTGVGLLGFTATPEMLLTSTAAPASTTATAGTIETKLPPLLKLWRGLFLDRVPNVARVGANAADPDRDLLGVLSLDASSREVRLREVQGIAYLKNMFRLLGLSVTADDLFRATMVNPVLQAAGIPTIGGGPRVAGLTWADEALRVSRPLVAAKTSETAALEDNYIQTIRTSSADTLRGFGDKNVREFQNPLLFHLLRQAALLEFARAGVDAAIFKQLAVEHDRVEVELFHISPGTLQRQGHWGRLTTPLTSVTGAQTLGKWLGTIDDSDHNAALRQPVVDHRAALEKLEGLPTAELERLFTETLDTCSHRVDAWITSIATSRLAKLRGDNPEGVHLGAFAWVEHLRPKPPEVVPPPASAPPPVTKGGYIHAPSMTHAATAAILRSAHLSRTGDARKQVTIDLSSARVRRALQLIDAVRQGQPIGAVLGYRLERALHDSNLDKYIATIRRRYPLGIDPTTTVSEGSTERLAARDVVNGLALRDAIAPFMQDAAPWTHLVDKLPTIDDGNDRGHMLDCLKLLDADVDAAADLLMAESIYQAVQGNVDRSSATLATLASGGTLPEPQIVKTPRAGTHYTNRVALVLGVPPTTPSPGWPASTPRGSAEPRLDAWLGRLLGNPGRVRCQISYASPTATNPTQRTAQPLTLAQLGLGPLDVLALAKRTGSEGTGELDARIRWHARTNLHLTAPVEIDHARSVSALDVVTFLEVLEMARLAGDVVSGARPLAPGDFVPPGAADPGGSVDSGELDGRVTAAGSALDAAKVDLFTVIGRTDASSPTASLDPLRAALWRTTVFGVREGVPGSLEGEEATAREALLDQARVVHAELVRRSAAAGAAASGLERMAAIFGPEQPILPTFVPSNAADLTTAILPLARLGGDRHAPRRWFERAARVRSPLGKLRLAALATEAAGGSKLDLEVAQFPNVGNAPWIGLPLATGAERPKAGTLSFVQRRELDFPAGAHWAGLLVDEWSEVIPDERQTTALAIHHDAPGAEAAQCVLLAVPSVRKSTWTLGELVAILHETLDLAKVRAVDAELLGPLALLAPCIYIASNLADDTVSLDLSRMRIKDTFVLAPESP